MSIAERFLEIRKEVPKSVTIVLAVKTRTPAEVGEAIEAGATDLGENYVQEAEQMKAAMGPKASRVRWHMIGALQTNKINRALQCFDVFQTIDSLERARAVDRRAARLGKIVPVHVEVNIGGEAAKAGTVADPDRMGVLIREMAALENITVEGLMTMGPLTGDPEDSRPHFRRTRQLFEHLKALSVPGVRLQSLSMGMSDSYRVAIEEGANMIRLGTVVFGRRGGSA